jgi:serine/threonine protein kinase
LLLLVTVVTVVTAVTIVIISVTLSDCWKMLRRIEDEIYKGTAILTVIDPFVRVNFYDETLDFDNIVPIGQGDQGFVYAMLVKLSDGTEERMVIKRLMRRRKRLLANSFSSMSSQASQQVTCEHESVSSGRKRNNPSCSPFDSFRGISHGCTKLIDDNLMVLVYMLEHRGEKFALSAYCGTFLDDFIATTLKHLYDNDRIKYLIVTKKIMLDTLGALLSLNYKKGYVHRDIKPENIALYNDNWILTDFEASIRVGATVREFVGSPYYTHPSCYIDNNKSTHPGNDLYALSLVFEAILFLPKRFKSETVEQLMDEKLVLYRKAREEKYLKPYNRTLSSIRRLSTLDHLIDITARMGCELISDQPDIHDIIEELLIMSLNDDTSFLGELYRGCVSDGYFDPIQEHRVDFERHASFKTSERRKSVVQCLTTKREDSDSDDDNNATSGCGTSPVPNFSGEFQPLRTFQMLDEL